MVRKPVAKSKPVFEQKQEQTSQKAEEQPNAASTASAQQDENAKSDAVSVRSEAFLPPRSQTSQVSKRSQLAGSKAGSKAGSIRSGLVAGQVLNRPATVASGMGSRASQANKSLNASQADILSEQRLKQHVSILFTFGVSDCNFSYAIGSNHGKTSKSQVIGTRVD